MRRPVFAANWKMNHGPSQARAFISAFVAAYSPHDDRTVVIFPPALSLSVVRDALGARRDIALGVQNIWTEEKGAFTGENSAPMAVDAGARYALVGHSERRHVFGETDEQSGRKCAIALRSGLTPVLCVGETLAQREAGETENVVVRQLDVVAKEVAIDQFAHLAIAYEPVWAIGTGQNATPQDASTVHRRIRGWLRDRLPGKGTEVPILYGGSVNQQNAAALLAAAEVDGLLVGGASLEPGGWASICRT
jgi:triosephosphate isomerase